MKGKSKMAIIDEIKEAEKKAQKIKDDAKAAARADAEMIETEAKNEAAERKKAAHEKAEEMISQAEADAKAAQAEKKIASDEECERIKASGREKVGLAADAVFERAIRL